MNVHKIMKKHAQIILNVNERRQISTVTLFRTLGWLPMGFHKSTLVARGAIMQLDPSCVSAPLATNMDLFAMSYGTLV